MARVTVVHDGDLRFTGRDALGNEVRMDASPEHGGGAAVSPMQNVLISLGGCSGMDVAVILRNRGMDVTHYEIIIDGENAEHAPKVWTKIDVEHIVRGRNLDPEAVRQAVESSTNLYCSVIAMLRETAVVTVRYRVENE